MWGEHPSLCDAPYACQEEKKKIQNVKFNRSVLVAITKSIAVGIQRRSHPGCGSRVRIRARDISETICYHRPFYRIVLIRGKGRVIGTDARDWRWHVGRDRCRCRSGRRRGRVVLTPRLACRASSLFEGNEAADHVGGFSESGQFLFHGYRFVVGAG
jgi:hypothetical protein